MLKIVAARIHSAVTLVKRILQDSDGQVWGGAAIRLITFGDDRRLRVGVLVPLDLVEPVPFGGHWPPTMRQLIEMGPSFREAYLADLEEIATPARRPLRGLRLCAPIMDPGQVILIDPIGEQAAANAKDQVQVRAVLSHPPAGPQRRLVASSTEGIAYEARLVAVLGRATTGAITARQAAKSIFGFSLLCDAVAPRARTRDETNADIQYDFGPWIVTADEVSNRDFVVKAWMQSGPVSTWVVPRRLVSRVLSWLSESMRFQPGDLLAFGGGRRAAIVPGLSTLTAPPSIEVQGVGMIRRDFT
jgi:hypothetical protein